MKINASLEHITNTLYSSIDTSPYKLAVYFKTGPGEYAEKEKFLGVKVPTLRKIAKEFCGINLKTIKELLKSEFNEFRMLGLIILVSQYKKANNDYKTKIYNFYIANIDKVNNWNLVDNSAYHILGDYLLLKNKDILIDLSLSKNMWRRRVAVVATLCFIKNGKFKCAFKIIKILLDDNCDLIHKACGWMLREIGKQDVNKLLSFLDNNVSAMPRVMLRYSIERLPISQRHRYLNL